MGAGATLILLVDASSAMEVVRASRKHRWSDIQIDSMPMSSANCASSIIS